MAIVVLLRLTPADGQFETVAAAMKTTLADTRAYAGCLGLWACADRDKGEILVYERWIDHDAQQAYIAWRKERGDLDRMQRALAAPPVFEFRDDLFG